MISFDIFDTLLTRRVATPYGIFALMQDKLGNEDYRAIPAYIRENFYTLRIHAEELARHNAGCMGFEEITLQDIYTAMSMSADLSEEQKETLCQLECEMELQNVLPIEQSIECLKQKVAEGEKVVLISDMYLPGKVIKAMLQKLDPVLCILPLYVSSELGRRKTTGNIYRFVKKAENVDYGEWFHYGDDPYQDHTVPGRLGITTMMVEKEPLMQVETAVLQKEAKNPAAQLLSGQARYARICARRDTQDAAVRTAERMGNSVCGPILYSYVAWFLKDCMGRGIKRLYFIARDGYLLKKIADIIIEKQKLPIETKYIYGSRRAWRFCSMTEENFQLARMLSWSYCARIHNISQFAKLMELKVEELLQFLPYGAQDADTPVNSISICYMALQLEKNPVFRKLFLQKQSENRALTLAYLQQELDVTDEHFAFVDLSGGGFTQGCLADLMATFCDFPVHSYFFKIDRVNLVKKCYYHVFFPSMLKNNLVVEMISHAPHGQTCGYRREGNRIVPVLDNFEKTGFKTHNFEILERALCTYAENLAASEDAQKSERGILSVIREYLIYVAQTPDQEMLDYFASFPNNETGREKSLVEYAPRLSQEDILNIFLRKMPWEELSRYYKGTNLEYSLLRCSPEERELVRKCKENYESAWGREQRADKIRQEEQMREAYGRAAYFPCELLEERVVLYGAGLYGRDLYRKIQQGSRSKVVQWVDKMKDYDSYPAEVEKVESIGKVAYDQILIGVKKEEIAAEIRDELKSLGVPTEKILWVPACTHPDAGLNWEAAIRRDNL